MLIKNTNLREITKNFYLCFMVVYMIIREVIPLQFLIDNILVSVAVFFVGFALILWDLLTDRDCLKGRPIDFFAAFIIISVISSIVNIKYGIASNIKCIAAMVLEYFVFFPQGFKGFSKKTLNLIFNTLIITLVFFIIISISMYFFSIDYVVFKDYIRDQGFDNTWGRLFAIFNDVNVISYLSLISIFASGCFMYLYRKLWAYILYGLNILLNITFIMLCMSRSAMLMMLFVPLLSMIYPFILYFKTNKKRAFGSLLLAVAASGILYGTSLGLNKGLPYVKVAFLDGISFEFREKVVTAYDNFYQLGGLEILNIDDNHIAFDPENPDKNVKNEIEEIERKDQKADYSNGRIARWMGGIEVFKTTPIIGTSPRNAAEIAKVKTPNTVMGKFGWVTHCSYLEILVNTGILGTIAMFGALIYVAVLFLKASAKKRFDISVYIAFLCFVTVAAGVFFVSDVFFVFTINALLFFYLLGYLYDYAKKNDESIVNNLFKRIFRVKEN